MTTAKNKNPKKFKGWHNTGVYDSNINLKIFMIKSNLNLNLNS